MIGVTDMMGAAALMALQVSGQTGGQGVPEPAATAAVPVPTAPVVGLTLPAPSPSPTPVRPRTPRAAPTPRVTPVATATPQPRATATSPVVLPSPPPQPSVAPPAEVAPAPAVSAAPATVPTTNRVPEAPPAAPTSRQWLVAALLVGLAVLAAVFVFRRRAKVAAPAASRVVRSRDPAPAPPAPPVMPEAPVSRAWIEYDFVPQRAGVNIVTATVDLVVVVRNAGEAAARDVLLDIRLLSAGSGQDAELGALFAAPIARPTVPRFDLAPGEAKRVRTVATLPRTAINVLSAGSREMFVPVVAVNAAYGVGEGATGQTAEAHAVGVAREGAEKLAPIWLDAPSRMHDTVAHRPYGVALRR